MSTSRTRNVAYLCVFLVCALVLVGCGSSNGSGSAGANSLLRIDLKDGGFAKGTPESFSVKPGALITLGVHTAGGGTYRLSVLAPSTAQTFKIPPDDSQTITIAKLDLGETAKLVVGKDTRKIVADATGGP